MLFEKEINLDSLIILDHLIGLFNRWNTKIDRFYSKLKRARKLAQTYS